MHVSRIKSSYIHHNYASLIRSLIKVTTPKCCVEFGILDGFSTIVIAHTLKELGQCEGGRHLFAYDLFERYPFTHTKYADVAARIARFGLAEIIELREKEIMEAIDDFDHDSIDFLHVDVSNTGDIIRSVINKVDKKILPGGLILFEGGSPLRDEVYWMKQYNKKSISDEIKSNETIINNYTTLVLHHYPSMLICSKNISVNQATWDNFGFNDYEQKTIRDKIDEDELKRILFEKVN